MPTTTLAQLAPRPVVQFALFGEDEQVLDTDPYVRPDPAVPAELLNDDHRDEPATDHDQDDLLSLIAPPALPVRAAACHTAHRAHLAAASQLALAV